MNLFIKSGMSLLLSMTLCPLFADPRPASLFQDGMLFQQQRPIRVWGTADPGEQVNVRFFRDQEPLNEDSASVRAAADGTWQLELPARTAEKGTYPIYRMEIKGKKTVLIGNILIGELFLAGGQSNMEVPVKEALNPEEEIKNAKHPYLREFKVEHDFALHPADSLNGKWRVVSPENAPELCAASYYFARELQKHLQIPVGIVNNAVSATPAQAWTPLPVFEAAPDRYGRYLRDYRKFEAMGKEEILRKRSELGKMFLHKDPGNFGERLRYAAPDYNDSQWKSIELPGWLETVYGELDGAFWFRKTLELPQDWIDGGDLTLELGPVDDHDVTYFNGVKIGATGPDQPSYWEIKRVYRVPSALLKKGKNVIAVRCFDEAHAGGLPGEAILLRKDAARTISLHGEWKTEFESMLKPLPWPADYLPLVRVNRTATVLYNAMFAPLRNVPFRGILWYQGESNADAAKEYEGLFQSLIQSWRSALGDKALPFFFVQLAAYQKANPDPNARSSWAELRAAQAKACALQSVYMVPTIDIGDPKNIHPRNKQELGRRLALSALKHVYGKQDAAIDFPEFLSAARDGKSVLLRFKNASRLQTVDGKAPYAFAVAAADGKYLRPLAELLPDGQIRLSAPGGQEIKKIRYAWSQNPEVNTVNQHALPILPFETDL